MTQGLCLFILSGNFLTVLFSIAALQGVRAPLDRGCRARARAIPLPLLLRAEQVVKVGKQEQQLLQLQEEEFLPCLHPYLALEHLLPPRWASSSLVLARRRLTWGGCRSSPWKSSWQNIFILHSSSGDAGGSRFPSSPGWSAWTEDAPPDSQQVMCRSQCDHSRI